MINIKLPDGSVKQVEKGTSSYDVAVSISEGLARNVLAAKVNGEIIDANRPIEQDADLILLTSRDVEGMNTLWHSSAHLMAEAIQFYYPDAKFTIGPPIENGFYYDVDFGDKTLTEGDLKKLEEKIIELARQKNFYERTEVSKVEALKFYENEGNEYKIELINELEDGENKS